MAKNPKFNVKLPSEAVRPLYAAAGVTDLAVEIARGYVTEAQVKVTDAQKKASQRVSSVDLEPKALQTKAVSLMNARVDELSKEAKARQERVEKAYAELQGQAKALRISAEQLYVHAGILKPDEGDVCSVELAILSDPGLTERQKQSLLDVYASFRAANSHLTEATSTPTEGT